MMICPYTSLKISLHSFPGLRENVCCSLLPHTSKLVTSKAKSSLHRLSTRSSIFSMRSHDSSFLGAHQEETDSLFPRADPLYWQVLPHMRLWSRAFLRII